MAFCAKCGATLKEGVAFCGSCGAPAGAAAGSATAGAGGAVPSSATSSNKPIASNVAALLTYVLGFITGIIFLVIEPYNKDKFVRFHAFQSIILNVAWVVFWIAYIIVGAILAHISLVVFGFLLSMLSLLLGLAYFLLWLFLMYKAYNNEMFKLPFIGDLAEKQAG